MNNTSTKNDDGIHLKLISVELKEASLDSPAFRASVNFFQTRVEILEDWIKNSLDFADTKYKDLSDNFQRVFKNLLPNYLPSPVLLGNGFSVNASYTPTLVDDFNRDYYEFSGKLFTLLTGDVGRYSKLIEEFVNDGIEPYKQKRTNFDYYQTKYDTMLANYQALDISSPDIGPSKIMENAVHLFDVRKSYLEASLELMKAISYFRVQIDKFLIDNIQILKSTNKFEVSASARKFVNLTPSVDEYFEDYANWLKNTWRAAENMNLDMESTKEQLFKYTLNRVSPSKDLNNYSTKELQLAILDIVKNSKSVPSASPEISGWLYMKTTVGNPERVIWVRRWCFLQNSVFGIFSLSPSKTYVEESDKFGVLNIDVRFEPSSFRMNCFQVYINSNGFKSPNIEITLQAETGKELRNWFKTIEDAKVYAASLNKSSVENELATGWFPPKYTEFASSSITSLDKKVTTVRKGTVSLMKEVNCFFGEFDSLCVTNSEKIITPAYHFNLVSAPMTTKLTQLSMLAHLHGKDSSFPDAVLINIWGVTNWSAYSVIENSNYKTEKMLTVKNRRQSILFNKSDVLEGFTDKQRILNSQFKSLFYSVSKKYFIPESEVVLFQFKAFWRPNSKQGFSANLFFTADYLYSYMNLMGFVCVTRKRLSTVVSVEPDKSVSNLLHLHNLDGSFSSTYVYFTNVQVIEAKVKYLLENKVVQNPKVGNELLKKLDQIELSVLNSKLDSQTALKTYADDKRYFSAIHDPFNVNEHLHHLDKNYQMAYRSVYNITAKGLLHIIYGDHSDVFSRTMFLLQRSSKRNINWCWNEEHLEDGTIQLTRKTQFKLQIRYKSQKPGFFEQFRSFEEVCLLHRIQNMIDNEYYEIDQDEISITFPFCHPFKLKIKRVISRYTSRDRTVTSILGSDADKCLYTSYYRYVFYDRKTGHAIKNLSYPDKCAKYIVNLIAAREIIRTKKAIKYYLDRIGKNNKIAKAIKLCGMLAVLKRSPSKANGKNETSDKYSDNSMEATSNLSFSLYEVLKYVIRELFADFCKKVKTLKKQSVNFVSKSLSKLIQINVAILMALLLSILLILFSSLKLTSSYWTVRKSHNLMTTVLDTQNYKMRRDVSIPELNNLISNVTSRDTSPAFQRFNDRNKRNDQALRDTRNELQVKRNELLMELKMLLSVENELVSGQYREFLLDEVNNCKTVSNNMESIWFNDKELRDYCGTCSEELTRLTSELF